MMMKKEKPTSHSAPRQLAAAPPPPRRRAPSNYQTVEDVAAECGRSFQRLSKDKLSSSAQLTQQPIVALTASGGPVRPPRPGANSFELLQAKFGFQVGNVRNQQEHFEVWVLNYESRILATAVSPVDTENAIETIHAKFFRNYVQWCKFLHTQPHLLDTAPYPGAAERQMALFLLIWGESGNLRFMPECLCFLYHKVAAKLDGIEAMPDVPEGTFLRLVVRPLYSVVAKMRSATPQKKGANVDHKNVTNYDDVNEFFWKEACLDFDEFTVAEAVNMADFKTFKERRSYCSPMLAFFRIYFFLFVMLHLLIVIAYVAYRSDPDETWGFKFYANFFTSDIADIRNHSFYSIFLTISGMLTLKVVLDVWLDGTRIFSHLLYALSVFARLLWHTVFFGVFAAVNAAPYSKLFGSSTLLTMAPTFIVVYMAPILIASLMQMLFRRTILQSAFLSSLDGTREQYVGRMMGQNWGQFLSYGTFWTVIFVCKFLFNLQLMVKPLIGPSVEIFHVDVSAAQLENGIIESNHNIAFLAAMWAPVILVYIYDSQIWLAIAQAIVGAWIGLRLKIGHSARVKEFVTRLHQAPTLFDEKVVSAAARGQLAFNSNPLSSNSVAPDANSRLRFAVVWNEIVSSFRLSDLLDDRETAVLQYQISDLGAVEDPVFLIAGKAQAAADIAMNAKTKRWSDVQLYKELKKADVIGCANNCVDVLFQILRQLLGPEDSEIICVFHQILAGGRVDGVVNLTHIGLVRENVVDLLASILDLPEPTVMPPGNAFGFPHEQVVVVVERVDALLKSIELMLEEESMAEKLRKSAFANKTSDFAYQKEQLLSIFADRISQRDSNPPAPPTSPSSNESIMSLSTRLFFLLTLDAADALPRCHEAQRRMSFFLNSLHMKIPNIDSIAAMKSFSVVTPYYNETVLFSIDELNGRVDSNPLFRKVEQKDRDLSILKYLVTFHDDEWAKLSNGCAESSLSRESHRMGAGMDFFRLNSMFYGHMGFYICNALVVLCVFVYAYGKVYIALHQEIEKSAITMTDSLDDLAEVMNTQFIFQFGMLMTIPLIATLFVEYGWHQAVVNFVELIVTLGPVFYIFETGTKSHFYDLAIMRGGSKYRGTGRGFAIVRETMVNFYKEYAASHYRKAVELMGLMIIFGTYGNFNIGTNVLKEYCATASFDCDKNPDQIPSDIKLLNAYSSKGQDYGIASFAVWLLGTCWLLAPFLFNTDGLDFSKTRVDITYWLSWLMSVKEEHPDGEALLPSSQSTGPVDTWNDFYDYEASLMYPVRPMSRLVYAIREVRHPLVMYYVFIFSFSLSQIGMLLACVGGIAAVLSIGSFGLGMFVRNKACVLRASLYVLMVLLLGVAPFIVGSMQGWDGLKSFSLTVSMFTGLFSLLHYLQLLHGICGLRVASWGLVRELAFFFDVVVGLFLTLPLLILSTLPFMKTIQTRMMYNGGFSRALSSGSEFAASLSVVVGGLGGFTYGWLTCLIFSLGYVNSSADNFVNQSFAYYNNEVLGRALDLSMIKVYAAGAGALGVILSGGLAHAIGRRWTIEASCMVTFAGCALVWLQSSSMVLMGICLASMGIAMLSLVCPLYNFEICMQGWKGKGVMMFLTSAALGFMIEAVLLNDINATAMSKNWSNSPYHDWQWEFIFGIIPIALLVPSVMFLPESHYWEYRRRNDPKAAEATLIRLRQRHDVLEEVHELKDAFVVKDYGLNVPFRIVLVTALQATFALFTSGALLLRVHVQPTPSQAGAQTSKWELYYGITTFVGTVLSLLTVDTVRRKTIFKDVLPFSAALSATCGALGFAVQEYSGVLSVLVCVAFVSGTLSLTCGTWLTAIEVFPPYQNGRYIVLSFAVYYVVQAAIYMAEPSFAMSHLVFAGLCLLLTVGMFTICASSKHGAIELKSEKKMRKDAEAVRNAPSSMTRTSRHTFRRSRSQLQRSSHYMGGTLTPQEAATYTTFESPASGNHGTRRKLNNSQGLGASARNQ
ncbi:hypothetical protein PsorP6_016912 [Peronosclerospora sorghi]|uniref:Uncharacterized protein n=1 Tax=Peronosclerospora sorghi TaxID=230839 RepID=A0ACC0WCU4_9STRA|nr:hypothetical protein PsorP6_016912 [Peronosclerospora sorghi]